jgi:hypothetical protein
MKCLRLIIFVAVAGNLVSTACAQYGLYGSPDILPVAQGSAQQVSSQPGYYPGIAPTNTQAGVPVSYNGQPVVSQPQPQWQPQPQPQWQPNQYPNQAVATPQPAMRSSFAYQPPAATYQRQRVATPSYPQQPSVARTQYRPPYQPSYPSDATYQPYSYTPSRPQPVMQVANAYQQPTPTAAPVPTPAMAVPPASPVPVAAPAEPQPAPPYGLDNAINPNAPSQPAYDCGYAGCNAGYPNGYCSPCNPGTYRGDVCGGESCGCNLDCDGCSPWYASFSAIGLGRSDGKRLWTSFETGNNVNQLTNTQDAQVPWAWGGEVQIGRYFCCGCEPWAVQGTFWMTESVDGYRSTTNPNTVSTPLQVTDLMFQTDRTADLWFEGAAEHRLWRRDRYYDGEISLVRVPTSTGDGSPWDLGWNVGFRYFRFGENLIFGSRQIGGTWESAGAAYLNDSISNDLFGVQIGFELGCHVADNVRLYISPKTGIYNNNMHQTFQAYLGDGSVGTTPYGPFPTSATRDDIAFLTQIDLGVDWQFSRNWGAQVGYRVILLNGIAEGDDQFPQYIVDIPEIQHIDNHSSLILHGAFAGVTYRF